MKIKNNYIVLTALLCAAALAALAGCEWSEDVLDIEKEDCFIMPVDVLTPEGETATLQARLEYLDGLAGIRGETLEFVYDGEVAGRAVTNSEGIAGIEFKPQKEGDYEFMVRLAGDSGRRAAPSPLTLCARKRSREFIITDVDKTISNADYLEFARKKYKNIKAMKDSAKTLRKLSQRYTIIYVTAREDIFRRKTKMWLEDKDFPRGPVFFWNVQDDKWSHREYKAELIAGLKRNWPNIKTGFGDLPGDAEAYLSNGLRVYIIRSRKENEGEDEKAERAEFPAGVYFFESWKDKKMLKELLPDED